MKIQEMFERDINRPINGVVKVNQDDEDIVFQELDEYVVTPEILRHFRTFYNAYCKSLDEVTDKMGVWVSGFFGSGKSHFLKILSYLLENKTVTHDGNGKSPLEFFKDKIPDPSLFGDIQRSVPKQADVILFNIDSKADNEAGDKDTVLHVFVKVFNEMQGFSGDIPELAEMERRLAKKGLFDEFKTKFKDRTGEAWEDERDAFRLEADDALYCYGEVSGQSMETVLKWYQDSEDAYSMSVEKFATMVKEYLDEQGDEHRVIFLVDEVGQYIGQDTKLMLNLQTIAEDLGRICKGRSWVIVTSQEDMDAILGDMPGARANDFSKIMGRFTTRISLSGDNTDQVIRIRLLEKTDEARKELRAVYEDNEDILKNQISFTADCATMKTFDSEEDFIASYPFVPYQFNLLQKIFESIRKVGASGAHLAKGERSMLDSFQVAAKGVQTSEPEVLVPLYDFYPAIEGFLEGVVIRTINQAADNASLIPFDQQLLKVLFLIRYVDLIRPNVENLTTLCITRIDENKLALRKEIQESLNRLKKENLIDRNGDDYTFLTNEERDVAKEISDVDLDHREMVQLLSDILFVEIFKDRKKHRLLSNAKDYEFNRSCDSVFRGNPSADLTAEVISPLNEDYEHWDSIRCIMECAEGTGKAIFKLSDTGKRLADEVVSYLQADKYIRKHLGQPGSPESVQRILRDRSEQNRQTKGRIRASVEEAFASAEVYVVGKHLAAEAKTADGAFREAFEYLIGNTYRKLDYVQVHVDSPKDAESEIRSVLKTTGSLQINLDLGDDTQHPNHQAFTELLDHLDLKFSVNEKVVLKDLCERFNRRPWGWPTWDTAILVTNLFRSGQVQLLHKGDPLDFKKAVEPLTKTRNWAEVILRRQVAIKDSDRKKSAQIVKDAFHEAAPSEGEELAIFIRGKLEALRDEMSAWQGEAKYADFPTRGLLEKYGQLFGDLLSARPSAELLAAVAKEEDGLIDFGEDYPLFAGFHKSQKDLFVRGREFLESKEANRAYYATEARETWRALSDIISSSEPYGKIPKIKGCIDSLTNHDTELLEAKRGETVPLIDSLSSKLGELAKKAGADADQTDRVLRPLQGLKTKIEGTGTIDTILAAKTQAQAAFEAGWNEIEKWKAEKEGKKAPTEKPLVQVAAADSSSKPYLESEEDVKGFIEDLMQRLLAEIAEGKRVKIK